MTIQRITARVLPVNDSGQVLLLRECDPAEPGPPYWSSVGGAVDVGESDREAAVRELREETGIHARAAELIGPVHHGVQAYSWNGIDYDARSTYFVLALDAAVEVSFDRLEPEEVDTVLEARWWSPDRLAGAYVRPPDLVAIMRRAVEAWPPRDSSRRA